MRRPLRTGSRQNGFSLLEMLLVVAILGIISAGILGQMDLALQRSFTEQVKVDSLQETRDFVDQFFRDISGSGYPNSRMIDTTSVSWSPALAVPLIDDNRLAVGLVKVDSNEVWFEGDVKSDGIVRVVDYKLNGSGTCPLCLQRSEVPKVTGNPATGQSAPDWGTDIDNVDTTNPVFSFYKADGTQVTALPADLTTAAGAQTIASIKIIKISLTVRSNSVLDLKTRQPIETTFEGLVSLNNCSMAASYNSINSPMGCR